MKIFLCYRRGDSEDVTSRIYDRLAASFSAYNVFRDIDAIPAGVDFREVINNGIAGCDLCLVIIGPRWLNMTGVANQRRIDNPQDCVRTEIEAALNRKIPVIPILIAGCAMPNSSDLPPSLSALAFRNARPIRPDPDFHRDMDRLIADLIGTDKCFTGPELAQNRSQIRQFDSDSIRESVSRLNGYTLIRTLMQDTLFLVREERTGRAVEVLACTEGEFDTADQSSCYKKCLNDARIASRLQHSFVVRTFDLVEHEMAFFLIQEHVAGSNIWEVRDQGIQLDVHDVFYKIACALQAAHSQGLVHGNLHPRDIIIDRCGNPHVRFPGIPRVGTPAYLAPEQVVGDANRIDGRSDIWSIGIVLYEYLTGRRPYEAGSNYVVGIQSQSPVPPRQFNKLISRCMERICLRCLARSPTDRYPTALDLSEDLMACSSMEKRSWVSRFL